MYQILASIDHSGHCVEGKLEQGQEMVKTSSQRVENGTHLLSTHRAQATTLRAWIVISLRKGLETPTVFSRVYLNFQYPSPEELGL